MATRTRRPVFVVEFADGTEVERFGLAGHIAAVLWAPFLLYAILTAVWRGERVTIARAAGARG